jgi:hypothetical protein
MKKDCVVCCEPYYRTRIAVYCEFCQFESCTSCVETYLLSQTDAHCMNCKKNWDRRSLNKKMKKVFLNKKYKEHRGNVLFDRERALLPSTQAAIELQNKLEAELAEINFRKLRIVEELYELKNGTSRHEVREFTRPCASNNCNGFISENYICGICKTETCKSCFEIKKRSHKCDPNLVENVMTLKKETIPCPKCAARIYKISGCDQMFCTVCHDVFSWKTGRSTIGIIHNPHYYEWRRSTKQHIARADGDIQCGRILDENFALIFDPINENRIRELLHIREVELPHFATNAIRRNHNLRIGFLKNRYDENGFKKLIQKNEKEYEKKNEYRELLTMFIAAATDIYFRVVDHEPLTYESELISLMNYVNSILAEISSLYVSVRYRIDENFRFDTINT